MFRCSAMQGRRMGFGPGGTRAPPELGILVNPIRTKGGRLCPPYYNWPPHLFGRCGASAMSSEKCALRVQFHWWLDMPVQRRAKPGQMVSNFNAHFRYPVQRRAKPGKMVSNSNALISTQSILFLQ